MKDRLSDSTIEIAHKISKIPFAKALIKPFYYPYKERINRKRNLHFRENALDLLRDFDSCMLNNGFQYSLIFGSLLGAVREKGFIKHDLDLDVAMFIEDRNEKLYSQLGSYGFKLIRRFSVDGGSLGCEETFVYKDTGVSIDIFYICPAIDEYPYCCCWNNAEGTCTTRESVNKIGGVYPRRIEQPIGRDIIRVPFESISANVTSNYEQVLEFAYGPDYMTPNPNYKVPTEHRFIWYDKIAKYEEFEW